jgi:hypothetical protein
MSAKTFLNFKLTFQWAHLEPTNMFSHLQIVCIGILKLFGLLKARLLLVNTAYCDIAKNELKFGQAWDISTTSFFFIRE